MPQNERKYETKCWLTQKRVNYANLEWGWRKKTVVTRGSIKLIFIDFLTSNLMKLTILLRFRKINILIRFCKNLNKSQELYGKLKTFNGFRFFRKFPDEKIIINVRKRWSAGKYEKTWKEIEGKSEENNKKDKYALPKKEGKTGTEDEKRFELQSKFGRFFKNSRWHLLIV